MPKPPRRPPPRTRKIDSPSHHSVADRAIVAKPTDPRQPGLFDEPLPKWIRPCLPTLVDKPPVGPQWVHEIKWDGYRVSAYVADGVATIRTRNGHDWTKRFPAIARAAAELRQRGRILARRCLRLRSRHGAELRGLRLGRLASGRCLHWRRYCWRSGRLLRGAPGLVEPGPAQTAFRRPDFHRCDLHDRQRIGQAMTTHPAQAILTRSTLHCPYCGAERTEILLVNACMIRFDCPCGTDLHPRPRDCCVFCSYGTIACPPIQDARISDASSSCTEVDREAPR